VEFLVHTYAYLLVVGAILFHNLTRKNDQLVVHASRLLNIIEHNYSTTKREALIMIFSLHKFRHYLLGNKFVFYVNHMALVYLVNKSHVLRKIARWLLLFLEYDFTVMYKPSRTHVIVTALSGLLDITEPIGVPNQTTYASLFYIKPKWLNDVK
jgi:hypothetical protein